MNGMMMSAEDFMKMVAGGASRSSTEERSSYDCSLDHAVQIERLKETLKAARSAYSGHRFDIGDLISPNPCYAIMAPGTPHIVIDRLNQSEVKPVFGAEPGSSSNGKRYDTRVAVMVDNDTIALFWVEGWQYEYYKP